MITVANRTETAARIKYAFDNGRILIEELCNPARTLHIDSKVLAEAEASEAPVAELAQDHSGRSARKMTQKQQAEWLRAQVDTVGQPGKPGENIQNVISVGMLSEGWDAKNVTHIMGLRAFSSQLLCEQVVGRGLRRTSYDVNPDTGLFEPEYVNIFGVPFTFLPHEGGGDDLPPPTPPKTAIEAVAGKQCFAVSWPNIVRIDHGYRPRLSLAWDALQPLELDASQTARVAELAPIVDGKPDATKIDVIELERLAQEFRTQRIVFEIARDMYAGMQPGWQGSKSNLLGQLVRLMEQFMDWGRTDDHARAVQQRCPEATIDACAEYGQAVPAHLERDPLRECRYPGTGVRQRSANPVNRRHENVVHRKTLRSGPAQPYQLLRP